MRRPKTNRAMGVEIVRRVNEIRATGKSRPEAVADHTYGYWLTKLNRSKRFSTKSLTNTPTTKTPTTKTNDDRPVALYALYKNGSMRVIANFERN